MGNYPTKTFDDFILFEREAEEKPHTDPPIGARNLEENRLYDTIVELGGG